MSVMSQRSIWLQFFSPIMFLALAGWVGAAPPTPQSRLATFQSSTGDQYFALSYALKSSPADTQPRDVVVMIDTSASQAGAFRDDSLGALQSFLASMGPRDRVQLVAVDINAVPLTDGFVASNSEAVTAAMTKLQQRAPLGSTDMFGALSFAADRFEKQPAASRSVVYIGDGLSRSNVIESEEFAGLMQGLVAKRISVSSFAIGPNRDVHLLATLANHTGGAVLMDSDELTAQQAGHAMARSVHADVFWPISATFSPGIAETYPKALPPIRSDRDSIVIGTLKSTGDQELKAKFEVNGRVEEHSWVVASEKSSADFSFLPKLVELARGDGGIKLPTVGSEGLREASRVIAQQAEHIAELGGQALAAGNISGAKAAAEVAIQQDPLNTTAAAVQQAVATKVAQPPAPPSNEPGLPLEPTTPAPADSLILSEGEPGKLLDTIENSRRIQAQMVQTEVEQGLNLARQKVATDPDSAINDLKVLSDRVEQAVELEADVRSQLRDRIATAIRQSQAKKIVVENTRASAQESQVAAIEAVRLLELTARKRQTIKQLLDKFNQLLEEGKYRAAEEDVAMQVKELDPKSATASAAMWYARNLKNVREMDRIRDLRHRNFVDSLYTVELSSIPTPDEPPIVYPAADVWEQLSNSRKKYASIDLSGKSSPSEQRILSLLEKEDNFEYPDSTLQDVVDGLSAKLQIPIWIDKPALEEEGIGTDKVVNVNYRGITLRSALRLILGELELTYMIQDEVLKITTATKAGEKLITKVYPVGDLVIPVGISGGGLGGGGGGGFGGQGVCSRAFE